MVGGPACCVLCLLCAWLSHMLESVLDGLQQNAKPTQCLALIAGELRQLVRNCEDLKAAGDVAAHKAAKSPLLSQPGGRKRGVLMSPSRSPSPITSSPFTHPGVYETAWLLWVLHVTSLGSPCIGKTAASEFAMDPALFPSAELYIPGC